MGLRAWGSGPLYDLVRGLRGSGLWFQGLALWE